MEEDNLDTTIQADVETEGGEQETAETPEQPKSDRELLMEKIDAQREEEIRESNVTMLEEAGLVPKKEETVPVIEAPKMVRVKIDGEEVEVPYEEVLTNYQKTSAADKRLRDAAAERTQLDNYRAELLAFQEHLKAQPAEAAKAVESVTDPALKKALQDVFEGEFDTAAEQIQRIIDSAKTQPSTPAMDEAKVMQAVEQKVAEIQYNGDLKKANDLFLSEYKDLNEDATLLQLVNVQYQNLLQSGVNPVEAAKEAGDATRNWLQSKTGKTATVDTEGRQKLKEKIVSLPQATAKTKSTFTPEADDVSSVIAEMKKARNQHY